MRAMATRRHFLISGVAAASAAAWPARAESVVGAKIARAARTQIAVTTSYDGAYRAISYPGGDVERRTGVCIDVVIRAYRDALQFDFQRAIHEDMKLAFGAYPKIWGLSRPDTNIDHRRVPNLEAFLTRRGAEMRPDANGVHLWAPGDLMTARLPGGLPHVGVASTERNAAGRPLLVHNIGMGVREEDVMGEFDALRRFVFHPA